MSTANNNRMGTKMSEQARVAAEIKRIETELFVIAKRIASQQKKQKKQKKQKNARNP